MANNIVKTLTKAASGFVGGFTTGGWAGGITGGTTAALTGGANKPLKSLAIGAGAGVAGGYVARSMDWQGETTTIGGLTFKPLSSSLYDYTKGFFKASAPGTSPILPATASASSPGILSDIFGSNPAPAISGGGSGGDWFPSASDYQEAIAQEQGGGWLPVAIGVGLLVILGVYSS